MKTHCANFFLLFDTKNFFTERFPYFTLILRNLKLVHIGKHGFSLHIYIDECYQRHTDLKIICDVESYEQLVLVNCIYDTVHFHFTNSVTVAKSRMSFNFVHNL